MDSNPPIKRRRLRSSSWEFFTKTKNNESATCKICEIEIKTPRGSNTGILRHLKGIHNIDCGSDNQAALHQDSFVAGPKVDLKTDVTKMAAVDGISFKTLATSETIRKLFESAGCSNYPISPTTIRDIVLSFYEDAKQLFKIEFKDTIKLGNKFSLSLDEWTSCANKRYMNLNLHTSEKLWNLGLVPIKGKFTSVCLQSITEKLLEFGVSFENDITCIVSDGAAVMKKLGRISDKWQQLCFSHGIHLGVTDVIYKQIKLIEWEPGNAAVEEDMETEIDEDLNSGIDHDELDDMELIPDFDQVVKKVRRIVLLFRRSPKNTEILRNYCQENSLRTLVLSMDVKTRWNSMVDMLEKVQMLRDEIKKSLIDIKADVELSDSDYDTIRDLVEALSPVKAAVKAICRSDANLVTCDIAVNFMFNKLDSLESTVSKQLHRAIWNRVQERRTVMSDLLAYLHLGKTNSQNGLVELPKQVFPGLSRKSLENNLKLFARLASTELLEDDDSIPTAATCASTSTTKNSIDDELNIFIRNAMTGNRSSSICDTPDNVLLKTIKKEMGLFECGGNRGKILANIYDFLMTIPPSSVESERVFSTAGNFCTKIRSRLGDQSLDALVFLKSFFKNNN